MAVDCPGLMRALDSITASAITGRRLLVLVETALAPQGCPDAPVAARGTSAARQVARAQLAKSPTAALAELSAGTTEAAFAILRADLLLELGRDEEALHELSLALALAPDAALAENQRSARVRVAARRGDIEELQILVAAAPIELRPRLAHQAASFIDKTLLAALGRAGPDFAAPVGELLESRLGVAAAVEVREYAVALAPDDADAWDALARSRFAAGRTEEAIAAWTSAATLAPAQPAFRIKPIEMLVAAKKQAWAQSQAEKLAADARSTSNVELRITASAGAAYVDPTLALALAREAFALRPGDGRIAFLVAQRLAEANDQPGAAYAYANLLVCGAHGKPWHRHEVAAKLQQLGEHAAKALAITRTCEVPEPADLAPYVATLRSIR